MNSYRRGLRNGVLVNLKLFILEKVNFGPHIKCWSNLVKLSQTCLNVFKLILFGTGHYTNPFWGHDILMATSIINRLPSSLLSWKTPFEILYQKPSTYDLLKVFGCLCFSTITQPHRDKFSPRATRCIFLGLSPGQKAFKLYDLSTHNIFVSRDVKFHEHIFPFQETPS